MPPVKMPPLSPAPSSGGEIYHHGLQHIARHNAGSPSSQEQYYSDEAVHLHPKYGSPVPGQDDMNRYRGLQPRYAYQQHQHQDSGVSFQYDGYNQEYHTPMYQDQYSTPASSPPTPSMSSQDVMRTRSGYTIPRNLRPMPEGRSRIEKSPKPKRPKKAKVKAEKKIAKLEKPLSELTKDWTHVPVADIETYVNRSAEDRRKEVEEGKVPGKVKRPMNSFMLYRKAYQNRTKDWCLQNNHQVVSQVCGDSWPLEPEAVREQFNEWARIERQNHQYAHPGYKFSPTKPGAAKGKRKLSEEPIISEESDLSDFEWQGGPSRRKKRRQSPMSDQPVPYPTTRSAYHYDSRDTSVDPQHGGYQQSLYHTSNPGRPLPAQYNQATLERGQYYQQHIQSNPMIAGVEDVIIHKAIAPGVHSFPGVPGGGDFDMMNPYQQFEAHTGPEHRMNVSRVSHDPSVFHGGLHGQRQLEGVFFGASNGEHQWQSSHGMVERTHHDPPLNFIDPELDNVQINDQHAHILKGQQEGWHVESLDQGQEFDKWMD